MQMPIPRHDSDPAEVGEKIKKRRKALGLSQDKLADLMGTDRNGIFRHEKGQNEMSICTLYQYADALETTPQALSPDRFQSEEETDRLAPLNRILNKLSDESLQAIKAMAEYLAKQDSKMQQI